MRYTRLLFGAVLIALTLWILVGEQIAGVSANAVINAPVITIRSSIAGSLSIPDRPFGARVNQTEVVASIDNVLVDRVRLNDLRMERDFQEAAIRRITERLETETSIRQHLNERTRLYRQYRLEELQIQLNHARTRLSIAERARAGREDDQRQDQELEGDADRSPNMSEPEGFALDQARERVKVLETAVRAAEQHVFLGDGYNDAPNSEQRAVELDSVIAGLEADLAEAKAHLDAILNRIQQEQVQINSLAGGAIRSPVSGLLWEVLEADGVYVQRGDPLIRLVDCNASFVTLSVAESVYNSLVNGQSARFRLTGSTQVFNGTVTRLAGSGAATIYEKLAVRPSQKHLERYDVALLVPEMSADPELGCAIGRTGRVFFETRPLDWLRNLLR